MRIVIIGSGNVATHLAHALYAAKHDLIQIWSHRYDNAKNLANEVSAAPIASLESVNSDADFCLIAVKDDAIPEVVAQLKGFNGTIAHTSGAVSIDVFKERFNSYGVFYPLQTFSKAKEIDFAEVPFCLESNTPAAFSKLGALAKQLSHKVVPVDSEGRKVLHLAAVFACNFTNHLYALAGEILTDHALDFDLIRPLIAETAHKVQKALPLSVQTGPAIRNDKITEQKHLELLENQPQLKEIYKTLSESIKKTR